jgi:hypothetical protein
MKRTRRIWASVGPEKVPQILPAIERLGLTGSWRQGHPAISAHIEHTFEENDARIAELRRVWKEAGLEEWRWGERQEATYTDKELRAAPLLELSLEASPREVVYDTGTFDLARGCPKCHSGAPQVAPMKIRPSALPKKVPMCQTIDFAYLLSEPLFQALSLAGLTGLELMRVQDTKGNPLAWWQFVPRHVMPPMAPETRGWMRDIEPLFDPTAPKKGCPACKRDRYCVNNTHEVPQIAYRRSQLRDAPLPDVAETWECQGVWSLPNQIAGRGRVLLSPKVYDIFKRFKIRGIQFTPVLIVED